MVLEDGLKNSSAEARRPRRAARDGARLLLGDDPVAMVSPSETDVVVVGGGPAGLAAALAARGNGLEVCVVERAQPPIEKACGGGLMPDGVAALRGLGVTLDGEQGELFRGIRFVDARKSPKRHFPRKPESGLVARRCTGSSWIMRKQPESTCWHAGDRRKARRSHRPAVSSSMPMDRRRRQRRFERRHWAGLGANQQSRRRLGLRRHFRVKPWTDLVEVHWAKGEQAYVTPVGPEEICVALLGRAEEVGFTEVSARFPRLAEPLETPSQ